MRRDFWELPRCYRARMDPARTLPRCSCGGPSASLPAGRGPCVTAALALLAFLRCAASSAAICALRHSSLQNAVSPLRDCTPHGCWSGRPLEREITGEEGKIRGYVPVHEDVAVAGEGLPAEEARVQEMHAVAAPRSRHRSNPCRFGRRPASERYHRQHVRARPLDVEQLTPKKERPTPARRGVTSSSPDSGALVQAANRRGDSFPFLVFLRQMRDDAWWGGRARVVPAVAFNNGCPPPQKD